MQDGILLAAFTKKPKNLVEKVASFVISIAWGNVSLAKLDGELCLG